MTITTITDPAREIPVTHRAQVVVVGGGSGGWSAAVAAARTGVDVLLIELEAALGGTSTVSMMTLFGGPYPYYHGLMKEVADRLAARGEAIPGPLTPYDGEALKRELFEMIEEAGVRLLLYTWFSKAIVENGVVKGVIVENKSGRQAILADVVIDATGDGDVAVSAGADAWLGRGTDGKMRPISLLFRIGNVDAESLLEWAEAHPEQFKDDPNSHIVDHERGLYRLHGFFGLIAEGRRRGVLDRNCHYMRFEYVWPRKRMALVNTTRIYGVSGLDVGDLTKASIEGRRQVEQLVEFIRSSVPGCQDVYLIDTAARLGIRETRHVVGDYVLREEDLVAGTEFSDTVVRDYRRMVPGAAVHSPDGNEGTESDALERAEARRLYAYNLPYRSFLPRGVDNLLISGRAFSADHQADGWTRDIPGIVLVGQATGTAAAIAVQRGISPRQVDLDELRSALQDQGVVTGPGAPGDRVVHSGLSA